eukprot:scaffold874_cov380-Prasinococcus_capsulatus_cf.AAC.16
MFDAEFLARKQQLADGQRRVQQRGIGIREYMWCYPGGAPRRAGPASAGRPADVQVAGVAEIGGSNFTSQPYIMYIARLWPYMYIHARSSAANSTGTGTAPATTSAACLEPCCAVQKLPCAAAARWTSFG